MKKIRIEKKTVVKQQGQILKEIININLYSGEILDKIEIQSGISEDPYGADGNCVVIFSLSTKNIEINENVRIVKSNEYLLSILQKDITDLDGLIMVENVNRNRPAIFNHIGITNNSSDLISLQPTFYFDSKPPASYQIFNIMLHVSK